MPILKVLWDILLVVGAILAFCTSVGLLVLNKERYEHLCERWPVVMLVPVIGGFMLLLLLAMVGGEIAREEMRAWPVDEFVFRERLHGFWDAAFGSLMLVTFHLWAFLVPGHCYARYIMESKGKRPWTPYVINILVGLLLCSPCNPIYMLFKR